MCPDYSGAACRLTVGRPALASTAGARGYSGGAATIIASGPGSIQISNIRGTSPSAKPSSPQLVALSLQAPRHPAHLTGALRFPSLGIGANVAPCLLFVERNHRTCTNRLRFFPVRVKH
jgi:hypothetical protein